MDFFTQPKGSTIGVLKDGRTVQEAIDDLGNPVYYVQDVNITPAALRAAVVEAARLGRTKGGIWFDGNYRDAAVRWNGQYVWVADNGSLKAAPTKPDSDAPSNGVVIGP